ncbi:MAG: restriction endonuclease, SacI family [Kiritimatiellae bacterium]|nr:restriction endonuclease, SacI family [Kiritimatiellia bacterium]
MAIEIDKMEATRILQESFSRCSATLAVDCAIRKTIDFVLRGKNCLTYRYILFAALVAKATNESADILSLQAGGKSEGAYDARSLASKVVYPFQLSFLGNILDGSNNDPLVNKPARFERLSPDNHPAAGDPQKALDGLCADLPKIKTSDQARQCLDYLVSRLIVLKKNRDEVEAKIDAEAHDTGLFAARDLLSELLDQGFGGAALAIAATALLGLQFNDENGFAVKPHPVNQSGRSSRQFSDLDVTKDGKPFMGVELKDRPFTEIDLRRAADNALTAGARSLLFVAGRQSSFAMQPPTYFTDARAKYAKRGLNIGLASIDALMDSLFAFHADCDVSSLLKVLKNTAEVTGALEAQMWVYRKLLGKAPLSPSVPRG